MNNVFRLVNPVYDVDTCIVKETVFTKQAKYESNAVFYSSLSIFNIQGGERNGLEVWACVCPREVILVQLLARPC